MVQKTCSKCGYDLPLSQFHKNKAKKDGLAVYCKDCERKRQAQYQRTNAWRQNAKIRSKKWTLKNRRKRKAHEAVAKALERGKLKREPCACCGCEDTQAHHEDYAKPLVIVWLCTRHHAERHVAMKNRK